MTKTKHKKIDNKNLRPQRGLGQAVSRQRKRASDQLKREAQSRRDRERALARELLEQRKRQDPADRAKSMWRHNLLKATIDNQSAVMKSYGINVPVNAQIIPTWSPWNKPRIKAWTDHKSIVIQFPEHLIPENRTDTESLVDAVATMRGVFQHELGHIRFTTPFIDLKFDEHTHIPKSQLHWPWNCLEDQRMETAVVAGVPRLASYFTTMIVEHIVKGDGADRSWLLLAGRTYLPTALRQQSRDIFVKVYGESLAQRWETEVQTYIGAKSHDELRASVIRAYDLLKEIMADLPEPSIDEHHGEGGISDPADGATEVDNDDLERGESDEAGDSGSGADESDDEATGDGESDGESGSESDADSDNAGDSGDANEDANEDGDEGQGESTDSDAGESSQDEEAQSSGNGATTGSIDTSKMREDMDRIMREAVDKATEEMRADEANNDILKDANDLSNGTGTIPFLSGNSLPMPEAVQAQAEALAVGMENSLNDFVTASQPVWMSHQEHGVIDPIAFRTKSVGDTDYRRGLNGDFTEGLDIHVSLLCDASVSMQGESMQALSQVIYATAKACDSLGIGLTTTLWSDDRSTFRILPSEVGRPVVYETLGGTDPTEALNDLDTHEIGNVENHLVIIFTDGEWHSSFPGVQQWERPGRHTVLVKYNEWWKHTPDVLGPTSDNHGCDEAFRIGDILNLPVEMTRAIAGLLSK